MSGVAPDLLARCTFPAPGAPLRCGVSGGADSLALLALAVDAGCVVTAVHVDHGVREGSAREAELVESAAGLLGASFEAVRVEVDAGADLEARCRRARLVALGPGAALGHTLDDRAETFLLNLLRGSGLHGLSSLRPDHRHPILRIRRSETAALCRALSLTPFADPSNDDPRFRRNRVRAEVVPLLDDVADRDTAQLLARTADLLAEDEDLLVQLASRLDPTDARALAAAPPPLARRAIRTLLVPALDEEQHPPDRATVDRVLAVACGDSERCEVGRGWAVHRRNQRLHLVAPTGR